MSSLRLNSISLIGIVAYAQASAGETSAFIQPVFHDIKPLNTPAIPGGIECVPYARTVSGIRIYGDAWTWWDQAEGRYARGTHPRIGAIMALKPYGAMQLGHVAVVSRIIDSRTVLLRHANWSPVDGVRGQIEENVPAVDVSAANDWSSVRVWFAPLNALGTTAWPVQGFIYKHPLSRPQREKSEHSLTDDPIGEIIERAHRAAEKEARLIARRYKLPSPGKTGGQ